MSELKPCPFCGGPPETNAWGDEKIRVKCRDTDCILGKKSYWMPEYVWQNLSVSSPEPCPLCGGEPEFCPGFVDAGSHKVYIDVRCKEDSCPLSEPWGDSAMSLDIWNSRPIEHMLHERINDLESRITLAIDLSISYDGFNDTEGLKSLIDDMVLALKGELKNEFLKDMP